MSLKAFHIVFITAAVLLSLFFGVWALRQYHSGEGSSLDLALGIVSLLFGAGLLVYGRYFLRKLRNISYL